MITKEQQLQRANELLRKHGLQNWTVSFEDLSRVPTTTIFGSASFGASGICWFGPRRILISTRLIGRKYLFNSTLLHEVAHALVGRRGHDHEWRRVAEKIGCTKAALSPYRIKV